jgi:sulfite reductase alpha subunit-like flavoprotein
MEETKENGSSVFVQDVIIREKDLIWKLIKEGSAIVIVSILMVTS